MTQDKEKTTTDGTYVDGDLVQIPLVNLELGPNYRSQLREMDSLVESVYQFGVLTPLWVEPHATKHNKYVVFAGRRRYEAARLAAQRRAKESSSDEALAVQVGRYAVPCRIFRNLGRARQVVFSLVENLVRTDPSAQDTATEMARARKVVEEELGRKVSVEEIMTLFEGAGRPPGKPLRQRHIYRLLRIAEMDERVLEEARRRDMAVNYLEALARLPNPDTQLALIELIQREKLTRQEVRLLVNEILASESGQTDLPALVAEVRRRCASPAGVPAGEPIRGAHVLDGDGGGKSSVYATGPGDDGGALAEPIGEPPTVATAEAGETGPLGKEKAFEPGERGSTLEPAGASEEGEGQSPLEGEGLVRAGESIPDTRAREEWLKEVEARLGQEEVARIKKALGEVPYMAQDIVMMRAMHMYKGILPEHLANYLEMVKETMAQSRWFGEVVASALKLLDLLGRDEEHKKLHAVPSRFFDILLNELYRAAAPYDQNLAYYLDRISRFRKEEFGRTGEAKG